MSVRPIRTVAPEAPDADWEGVRTRLMTALAATAPSTWSDHNPIEPGVTLTEAIAFGLADLHYRTATRPSGWPLEVPAWHPDADRHWHAPLPPAEAEAIATALAGPAPGNPTRTVARELEPQVRACAAPNDALALLTQDPWTGVVTGAQAPAVIALLRGRLVRRLAHELTDLVGAAVDAERDTGGTVAERDARAAESLATAVPLWPAELAALVRRERRRRSVAAVLAHVDRIATATTASAVTRVLADLAGDGLDPIEAHLALGLSPTPVDAVPEDFESDDGAALVWPPHPLQSLTCEPVTADDYARRARSHDEVLRAWAVPGRLAGVGWDGREISTSASDPGAVTLVVERMARPADIPASMWATTTDFLRDVLRTAIGSEVDQPHPTWQDTFDPLDPRRLICDEVGATVLRVCPVVLQATLVTGVGADRATTIGGALARVATHFAQGRPESRPAAATGPLISGPWPRNDQPAAGWLPGESIRLTEVVAAIAADPAILGVENLSIKVGTESFIAPANGAIPLAPDCIPELADVQCLRVRFALTGECGHA